jgi:hypothetical protein
LHLDYPKRPFIILLCTSLLQTTYNTIGVVIEFNGRGKWKEMRHSEVQGNGIEWN